MARRSLAIPGQWLHIGAATLFAAALAVLLLYGIRRADELQSASTALQLASELSARPQLIRSELTLIQRGLETTTYIGDSLHSITSLRQSSDQAYRQLEDKLREAGLAADTAVAQKLAVALARWRTLDLELEALNRKKSSDLYIDTPSGSELTASGKQIKGMVDGVLESQASKIQPMVENLTALAAALRVDVAAGGRSLRTLLLGGTLIACLLLGLMLYYAARSRAAAAAAAKAERQVANILATVREGLFLIGRDLKIGEICSDSMRELLRQPAPAGCSFEDILRPLVDERTLSGAVKYLGLLWREKVHEELIESVNPLSQIEVSFANAHGGAELRYLAFNFRRVRGAGTGDYVLGAVADVTDRVLLARELEQVKTESDSQSELLLQLLRVEPAQLQMFLSSADVAFRKSNAMLTERGTEQEELRAKLNGVFRELHATKGEAAALALTSFVERIHAAEDKLAELRNRHSLTGNDFLPIVVKLDDLMSLVAQIQSMQERMATLRAPARPPVVQPRNGDTAEFKAAPAPRAAAHPLHELFRSLAHEVAASQASAVRVETHGLDLIPPHYAATVKDICLQMIRNAIVHGIEPAEERARRGKPREGTLQISFADDGPDYLLTVEDDGRGLSYEQIIDKALRQGMLRPNQAQALERTAAYRLIFQPGFSTTEAVSEHAGRGVGLDTVGHLVREHHGKIGVSTAPGQHTRFKVLLPKSAPDSASSAA